MLHPSAREQELALWLEWAMPRDLMMLRLRLRSPPLRTTSSKSQVSMREEMPTSVFSSVAAAPREAREQGGDASRLQEVDEPRQHGRAPRRWCPPR